MKRTAIQEKSHRHSKAPGRDEQVLAHLPLVKAIALRLHGGLPVCADLDDLIQAGTIGLIDAVGKYKPEMGVAFNSYAKYRIRGAMLDSLRGLDWASRDTRRTEKRIEAARAELRGQLRRTPTETELAERMEVDLDQFRRLTARAEGCRLVSLSSRGANQDEDMPAPDYPAGVEVQPEHQYAQQEVADKIATAMLTLSERYRAVLSMYYKGDMTMREIGSALGVNESRVSQIHKVALERLSVALVAAGVKRPVSMTYGSDETVWVNAHPAGYASHSHSSRGETPRQTGVLRKGPVRETIPNPLCRCSA